MASMSSVVIADAMAATLATTPYRTDRVDHMARLQAEAGRNLGLAGLATAERGASHVKLGAGRAVDRAIDDAAAEQAPIGGVDDGGDVERGDIGLDDRDAVKHRALDAGSTRRSR